MTDSSFAVMTTVTCSTERTTSPTSGYVAYLSGLKCTPLAPVDAETRLRLQIDTPVVLWEVHLQDNPDIKAGHKLVIGSNKFPVKTVESWVWLPTQDTRTRLILEDTRN